MALRALPTGKSPGHDGFLRGSFGGNSGFDIVGAYYFAAQFLRSGDEGFGYETSTQDGWLELEQRRFVQTEASLKT